VIRLNRWERPMLYGVSGSSKWLIDASMVIWNVVGIVALVALVGWIRQRGLIGAAPPAGRRGLFSGRTSRLDMPFSQMAHARSVVGDETSEDILARELARSATPHRPPDDTPTSEDILRQELAQTQHGHGEGAKSGREGI
jgi:hypothetical protein